MELKGDEMADVIRDKVVTELVHPFMEFRSFQSFDLSVTNRDKTNDTVLRDAIAAAVSERCIVKTSSITPSADDAVRLGLNMHWTDLPSAAGKLRAALGGTIFRECLYPERVVGKGALQRPVVVARCATGGLYNATEIVTSKTSTAVYTHRMDISHEQPETMYDKAIREIVSAEAGSKEPAVYAIRHRTDLVVRHFAEDVLTVALRRRLPVWLSAKNSLSALHEQFVKHFMSVYNSGFRKQFEEEGLWVKHCAPDVMVAKIVKSEGGFMVACQNYDGELLCPLVGELFGGAALMSAQTVNVRTGSLMGYTEHGTIHGHWKKHLKNPKAVIKTDPVAIIGSWTRALGHRAKLDKNKRLGDFAEKLAEATSNTIDSGVATPDLLLRGASWGKNTRGSATTDEFLKAVRSMLETRLGHEAKNVKLSSLGTETKAEETKALAE